MPSDCDDLKAKRICFACVGEKFLSAEILEKGEKGHCSYCEDTSESYTIGEMAERIDSVFDEHYIEEYDTGDDDPSGTPVGDAIEGAGEIPTEAASDILEILQEQYYDHRAAKHGEECHYSSDSYFAEKGVDDRMWQEEWRNFERSLKTEARFFSRIGAEHLAQVFNGIDKMRTSDNRPLVVDAGPDTPLTALYRARVFQSDEKLKEALSRPDQHLGSPAMMHANAGRMNARGISVFYGANKPEVAIAEVRPPVGSQVTVARFTIIRSLLLLDLTAVSNVSVSGSIFDPTFSHRLERASFLRSLSERITKPVMPDDEAFEYLPTQAIADFLATENDPPVDGIIFPSAQVPGSALNVVLFHKAARVKPIVVPEGTKFTVWTSHTTDEGVEPDYSVHEEVPPPKEEDQTNRQPLGMFSFGEIQDMDNDWFTDPTLELDLKSIKVHRVRSVTFHCDEYDVSRHRWEKQTSTKVAGSELADLL